MDAERCGWSRRPWERLYDSHDLGGLGDGKLVLQNAVEHLDPGLFLLNQRYMPHRDDIFADQLAGGRIVDHQHNDTKPVLSESVDGEHKGHCFHRWQGITTQAGWRGVGRFACPALAVYSEAGE